jgi:hypothetical protein
MSSLVAVCVDSPAVSAPRAMARYVVFAAIWVLFAALGSLFVREVPDSMRELVLLVMIGPPVVLSYLAAGELFGGRLQWMRVRLPVIRHVDHCVSTRAEHRSFSVLRIVWGPVLPGGVFALLVASMLVIREHR